MNQSNSVTTYIRQKPLFDDNKNNDNQSFPFSKSLQFLGIKPNASRTKAFLHLSGDWEGRDALLVSLRVCIILMILSFLSDFIFLASLKAICSIHLPSLLFNGTDQKKTVTYRFRKFC